MSARPAEASRLLRAHGGKGRWGTRPSPWRRGEYRDLQLLCGVIGKAELKDDILPEYKRMFLSMSGMGSSGHECPPLVVQMIRKAHSILSNL